MSIFTEMGVREGKDRAGEEFLYNLACCYMHAERLLAQLLARYGLTPVKMNALLIVKHVNQGKGLTQHELARRLIVSPGNVTRLIDRLEKENLIVRTADSRDRRVNYLRVTPKASALLDRVWLPYKKRVNEIAGWASKRGGIVEVLNAYRTRLSQEIAKEEA